MQDGPPQISAHRLCAGHGGHAVVPATDLSIRPREFWALVGRNGLGKSTLLKTLIGLLPPVSGRIERSSGLRVGYVPQRSDLDLDLPLRVIDIVRDGAEVGWSFISPTFTRSKRHEIERALAAVDCLDLAHRRYSTLSEGQKQRALLARVLTCDPQVLVLDEPTSSMDLASENSVFELVDRLRIDRALTLLVVNHRVNVLAARATHVAFLHQESHRVAVEVGPFSEVSRSPNFTGVYGDLTGARAAQSGVSP